MKTLRYIMARCLFSAALLILFGSAQAAPAHTPCSKQSIARLVHDLQVGQVILASFTPQVQKALLDQTVGTLQDPKLAALGQVKDIQIIGIRPGADSTVCGFETDFSQGAVIWQVSYNADGLISGLDYGPAAPAK
jgi:hypothetical protein